MQRVIAAGNASTSPSTAAAWSACQPCCLSTPGQAIVRASAVLVQDLAAAIVVQLPLAQRQVSQAAVTKVQVSLYSQDACHGGMHGLALLCLEQHMPGPQKHI